MTKKFVITIGIVALLGAGGWYVKKIVTDKIYSQLSEVIASPEVQKEIEAAANSEAAAKALQDPSLAAVQADVQKLTKNLPQQVGAAEPKLETKTGPAAASPSSTNEAAPTKSSDASVEGAPSGSSKPNSEAAPTPATAPSPNTNTPVIKNRSEAVTYAMKKFTVQEIEHYSSLYKDRQNLTPGQKQQIKTEVLSRFTPEEIKALLAASNH